jgi:hypothetical protein
MRRRSTTPSKVHASLETWQTSKQPGESKDKNTYHFQNRLTTKPNKNRKSPSKLIEGLLSFQLPDKLW